MNRMALAVLISLSLLGVFSAAKAESKLDRFTACKLYVLASNCNIGRDENAPAFMRTGGPASCFAGLDAVPEAYSKLDTPFRQVISEEGYTRTGLEKEIDEINACLVSPDALRDCRIGFVVAGGDEGRETLPRAVSRYPCQ